MALDTTAYRSFKQEMIGFIWKETTRPTRDRRTEIPATTSSKPGGCASNHNARGVRRRRAVRLAVRPDPLELSKIHGEPRDRARPQHDREGDRALGSEEQKRALLPKVATGEWSVAFGLTEPDAGTGRDLKTRAVRDGDHFVVNGRKHLITNSEFASHFMVFGYTDPSRGARGISALMVDRGTPGFTIADMPERWGAGAASTAT
jgi:hypothetical protein